MREKSRRPLVPKFKTEAEEAKWWYDNRNMVEKEFMTAIKNGTVGHDIAQRLAQKARESKNITIRMPVADISRAWDHSTGEPVISSSSFSAQAVL